MLRCRFTLQAEQDLTQLSTFIAKENPSAAAMMLDILESKCQLLGQHPEIGRKRYELFPDYAAFPPATTSSFTRSSLTRCKSSGSCMRLGILLRNFAREAKNA